MSKAIQMNNMKVENKAAHEENRAARNVRLADALNRFASENVEHSITYLNINGFAMPVRNMY